jgi:hypothetical protein
MLARKTIFTVILAGFGTVPFVGQQSPQSPTTHSSGPTSAMAQELPIVMEQNVVAGKTAVGTEVRAKLQVATLVNGKVIPRSAILLGEVLESTPFSPTSPSRLSVRIDSAQWKNDSSPLHLYLTSWFYPSLSMNGPDLKYGPEQPARRTWNGMGQYPDSNSPAYRPFPKDADANNDSAAPSSSSSDNANHRVQLKNVESETSSDGGIILRSKHGNLKFDKFTTYVLAPSDLLPTHSN